jgi:hypothetical protein
MLHHTRHMHWTQTDAQNSNPDTHTSPHAHPMERAEWWRATQLGGALHWRAFPFPFPPTRQSSLSNGSGQEKARKAIACLLSLTHSHTHSLILLLSYTLPVGSTRDPVACITTLSTGNEWPCTRQLTKASLFLFLSFIPSMPSFPAHFPCPYFLFCFFSFPFANDRIHPPSRSIISACLAQG